MIPLIIILILLISGMAIAISRPAKKEPTPTPVTITKPLKEILIEIIGKYNSKLDYQRKEEIVVNVISLCPEFMNPYQLLSQIYHETARAPYLPFSPDARGYEGEIGLMQLRPPALADVMGIAITEAKKLLTGHLTFYLKPANNIFYGTFFLEICYNRYVPETIKPEERLRHALAIYNMGIGSYRDWPITRASVLRLYSDKILNRAKEWQK